MTAVTVSLPDLRAGRLPARCVRSGAPATRTLSVWVSPWPVWVDAAFAVVGFPLLALVQERVRIPVNNQVVYRSHPMTLVGGAVMAVGALSMLIGGPGLVIAGAVGIVVGLSVAVTFNRRWVVRTRRRGDWVTLSDVHPRFAADVDQMVATGMLAAFAPVKAEPSVKHIDLDCEDGVAPSQVQARLARAAATRARAASAAHRHSQPV